MRFRVQKGMRRFEGVGMYFKVYTPIDVPVSRRVACVCSPISDAGSFDSLCRELAKNGCLCVTVELPEGLLCMTTSLLASSQPLMSDMLRKSAGLFGSGTENLWSVSLTASHWDCVMMALIQLVPS